MSSKVKAFGVRFGAALLLRIKRQVLTFVRRDLKAGCSARSGPHEVGTGRFY